MLRLPGRAKFRSVPSEDLGFVQNEEDRDGVTYNNLVGDEFHTNNDQLKSTANINSGRKLSQCEPATLRPSGQRWLALIASLIGITPFFCLAWAAVGLNGKKISQSSWDAIKIAMKVEVTLFPLVYAAIVGLLRSIDLVALVLIILWAFSPLAAQASLRILSASPGKTQSTLQLQCFDFAATNDITPISDWYWIDDPGDELFIASLVTAKITRGSTTDIWGNVNIPLLSNLTESGNSSDWIDVSGDNVRYASQLGMPIFGLLSDGLTSTTINTSYLDFQCYDLRQMTFEAANVSALNVPEIIYVEGNDTEASVVWKSFNFENGWERDSEEVAAANCTVTLQSVLMDISCNRTSDSSRTQGECRATRVQKNNVADSSLPDFFSSSKTFDNFTQSILKALPFGQEATPTVLDYWMSTPFGTFPQLDANITLYELSPDIFSQRLTQMVNSFYMARLGYQFMTRTSLDGLQSSTSGNGTTVKSDSGSVKFTLVSGNAVEIDTDLTLSTNPGWITAFILTIVVMMAASIITFYITTEI
ncbi:uncharacterized protein N7483_005434 [Penicillium malachiteum]|uniref:uncharacterized protein n=1 Tax=Penicillium malachiteum TaxID=1324776 RepID=UPI002549540F|nr:uncharacterized protein N7483_005434 [Penicillium malachiteum]KAJ5730926.1 hypothetical protein N7483_005434 [Penicillium malachiteum]